MDYRNIFSWVLKLVEQEPGCRRCVSTLHHALAISCVTLLLDGGLA